MKINLVYYSTGVGVTRDAVLLHDLLGGTFEITHVETREKFCPEADFGIFLQTVDAHTIERTGRSKVNILIPNLDWLYQFNLDCLGAFDYVLAKSHECKRILDRHHPKVIYTGFTSVDRFRPEVPKSKQFLHFAGRSIQKNTELVLDVFSELQVPITVVDSTARFWKRTPPNVDYVTQFLSVEEVKKVLSLHRFHICCSLAEGWGHYVYEALSAKGIVIANDCPPLNENLDGVTALLVKTTADYPNSDRVFAAEPQFPYRKLNFTDREDLLKTIRVARAMPEYSAMERGEQSRRTYEFICARFKRNLEAFFEPYLGTGCKFTPLGIAAI